MSDKNALLFEESKKWIARDQSTQSIKPIFISCGRGNFLIDENGVEYLDTCLGFGALIMGHAHPKVSAALEKQIQSGWHYGIRTTLQTQLAKKITELHPAAQSVMFCNTGSEATMYALRLARAISGKSRVVLFEGSYHGNHDAVVAAARRKDAGVFSEGVLASTAQQSIVLPYGDTAAVEKLLSEAGDDIAAFMVQPIQNRAVITNQEFLSSLREITRKKNIILIFDEVVTGFRIALNGASGKFGIVPDLVTFGKVVGGGVAIGVLAGNAALMERFARPPSQAGAVYQGGTYSGNPLAMAAGMAALTWLEENAQLYEEVGKKVEALRQQLRLHVERLGLAVRVAGLGTMTSIHFQQKPVNCATDLQLNDKVETAFVTNMRGQNIFLHENRSIPIFFPLNVQDEQLERFLQSTKKAIEASAAGT